MNARQNQDRSIATGWRKNLFEFVEARYIESPHLMHSQDQNDRLVPDFTKRILDFVGRTEEERTIDLKYLDSLRNGPAVE